MSMDLMLKFGKIPSSETFENLFMRNFKDNHPQKSSESDKIWDQSERENFLPKKNGKRLVFQRT